MATNALQVKADVVNELRNTLYYNQHELQRLLNDPARLSHKDLVNAIVYLLREDVIAQQSIGLIERYFSQPEETQESAPVVADGDGIKKID